MQHEGIQFDYDKAQKNPGLCSLAKLILNSFWGTFGYHPSQTQVTTCTKAIEFFTIIQDNRQVIFHCLFCNQLQDAIQCP